MIDPRWFLGCAVVLFIIFIGRLLRQNPMDAERAWLRQERLYRQRGLVTQRPENWEQIYRRSRIGLVLLCLVLATIVMCFISRIYAF